MGARSVSHLNKHSYLIILAILFILNIAVYQKRSSFSTTGAEPLKKSETTSSRIYPPTKYTLETRKRVRQLLYDVNDNTTVRSVRNRFFVAPQYRLATCDIDKVMSTVLMNIHCYLYDEELFFSKGNTITGTWWSDRACEYQNERWTYKEVLKTIPLDINPIMVVREPIGRFISSFTDKCINELSMSPTNCLNCNGDIHCFVGKLPGVLNRIGTESIGIDNLEKAHFAPQLWFCDLPEAVDDVHFIQFNTKDMQNQTIKPLLDLFKFSGVTDRKLNYLRDSLSKPSKHTTSGSDARTQISSMIASNQTLYNILIDIYRLDYAIFAFPIPSRFSL